MPLLLRGTQTAARAMPSGHSFLGFYTLNAANVKSCIARAKIIAAERKFLPKGTSYCKDIKIFENGVVINEIGVISVISAIKNYYYTYCTYNTYCTYSNAYPK